MVPGSAGASDTCAFHAHWRVEAFDAAFGGLYREHMFRFHELTPTSIRVDVSQVSAAGARQPSIADRIPEFLLRSDHTRWAQPGAITLGSGALGSVPSSDVVSGLAPFQDVPVIRLAALYDVDVMLDVSDAATFSSKWSAGIKPSTVRQY
jgi:hypothetical protein